jgi:hypothetical protein
VGHCNVFILQINDKEQLSFELLFSKAYYMTIT